MKIDPNDILKRLSLRFSHSRLMLVIKPGKFPYNVVFLFPTLLYSSGYRI